MFSNVHAVVIRGSILAILLLAPLVARACPFCTAVGPPFSQRRAAADWVLLAEVLEIHQPDGATSPSRVVLTVQRTDKAPPETKVAPEQSLPLSDLNAAARVGSLLLLSGVKATDTASADLADCDWESLLVDEASYGYFARLPLASAPARERLSYAARYLEHANAAVADDAYREFALAPFDQVSEVATQLPPKKLQAWLTDAAVPQERQGLYGLVLGLSSSKASEAFLRKLVLTPSNDFRAGYDGILGGYLLAAGEPGLQLIEKHLLGNRSAAVGDVRHALTALRFYHQFGTGHGKTAITKERLAEAMEQLLAQPDVAAAAVIDLARWQHWSALPRVVKMYPATGAPSDLSPDQARDLRRAVIGYLLECPQPAARTALATLRTADPRTVTALEARHAQEQGSEQ